MQGVYRLQYKRPRAARYFMYFGFRQDGLPQKTKQLTLLDFHWKKFHKKSRRSGRGH